MLIPLEIINFLECLKKKKVLFINYILKIYYQPNWLKEVYNKNYLLKKGKK